MTRRRLTGRIREAITAPMPNRWTTVSGDVVEVFADRPGPGHPFKWYWRLVAPNGKQVASSGQGFTRARSARRAAHRMFPAASS